MALTLDDLCPGESGVIIGLDALGALWEKRMLDLGLMVGETVTLLRRAPLGDPLLLWVKGYQLALRRDTARSILIKRKEKPGHDCGAGPDRQSQ